MPEQGVTLPSELLPHARLNCVNKGLGAWQGACCIDTSIAYQKLNSMQTGHKMADHLLSRWDGPAPENTKVRLRRGVAVALLSFCVAFGAVGAVSAYGYLFSKGNDAPNTDLATELRAALSGMEAGTAERLQSTVDAMRLRLDALEAENKLLRSEYHELTNHDGVIPRIITHVRALHAQNEATRRDVVGALTLPLEDEMGGEDLGLIDPTEVVPVDGQRSQFLTKARHTVVTPAAASDASGGEPVARAKPKAEVADPEEGATN